MHRVLPALAILLASMPAIQLPAAPPDYYPTNGWHESTPEAQGLDSPTLAGMVESIAQKHLNVHSVTVIRHGNIVLDSYFYPYRATATHDVASISKSITAAVSGIAVDKGLLKTDQTMLSFFPEIASDPQKRKITIADLLSMQSGLDCGFLPGEQELEQMRRSPDFLRYALNLPMKYDPGTKFGYCSPGYHILSGIISTVVKEPEFEFARKNLFKPLGIKDVVWPPDEQGRTRGWGDSHFYPRDFAKIGYLYLHGGLWEGKQVISADWIRNSITKRADPGRGAFSGYGLGWWLANVSGLEEFGGNGRGGQRVMVWAEKDMIVVITGSGYPANEVGPVVVRAVKSDSPLPENPAGVRDLLAKVADVAKAPAPLPVRPLPAMAHEVSGVRYDFPRNPSRLDALQFTFSGDREAQLNVTYLGAKLAFPVGLDGVYRLGPYGPLGLLAGATGRWTSDTDFLLDLNFISNINHYTAAIHFGSDQIEATINESSGLARNVKVAGKRSIP
jgi:CubicO group peptidase (beta-lactamase class C family)